MKYMYRPTQCVVVVSNTHINFLHYFLTDMPELNILTFFAVVQKEYDIISFSASIKRAQPEMKPHTQRHVHTHTLSIQNEDK